MHVVQPPGVRLLLAYRVRLALRVVVVPRVLAQPSLVVAEAVLRRASRPAGIFPLRLGGQPELPPLSADLRIEFTEKNAGNRPSSSVPPGSSDP